MPSTFARSLNNGHRHVINSKVLLPALFPLFSKNDLVQRCPWITYSVLVLLAFRSRDFATILMAAPLRARIISPACRHRAPCRCVARQIARGFQMYALEWPLPQSVLSVRLVRRGGKWAVLARDVHGFVLDPSVLFERRVHELFCE
jgi:hypothetical protein